MTSPKSFVIVKSLSGREEWDVVSTKKITPQIFRPQSFVSVSWKNRSSKQIELGPAQVKTMPIGIDFC